MALARKHTLIDLFAAGGEQTADEHPLRCIEIPAIQRDYAQGRNSVEVKRIRKRFLAALYDAATGASRPITLDFIYGDIDATGKLVPLDGQQRLTTLFLLHWYVSRHENIPLDETAFLGNFSYATRYSAREFCRRLVDFSPDFSAHPLSNDIADQDWMPIDWQHDPTIKSMLQMIDDIHCRFEATSGIWRNLKAGAISFYFLPIKVMDLTDELYIKMNSRGKALTEFEHFKAEWESRIAELDQEAMERISKKIDTDWTYTFWPYHDEHGSIDSKFMKYFRFLCDAVRFKKGWTRGDDDIFDFASKLFGPDNPDAIKDILWIERAFDCWTGIDIDGLFDRFLSISGHVDGKCLIAAFRKGETDSPNIFEECCMNYSERESEHRRKFPIGRSVLLYSFVFYLMNKDKISEEEFARRIRIIVNLIKGSEFGLRERDDSIARIFMQAEEVLETGDISTATDAGGFGYNQRVEEHAKVLHLAEHPDDAANMFALEDHTLLYGAIRAIGIENVKYASQFESLFSCDWALVDRALLTIGDYSMKVRDRFMFGSGCMETPWRSIFRNRHDLIGPTKRVLNALLEKHEMFDNAKLEAIIEQYLNENHVYDWRHYLIKYTSMHLNRYGMYRWTSGEEKTSYEILMMWTEKNITGRNWNVFLKALHDKIKETCPDAKIRLGSYAYAHDGDKLELVAEKKAVGFDDNAIKIFEFVPGNADTQDTYKEIDRIKIWRENGIDMQDRVELAYRHVMKILAP
ncbi:MAG: DUF262 domain-containing protein [Kiritimatiellae bacterium]|nr:DUF262 domain-containing protein [Kiritimatiellia bacterium]